jgi:hypothetical protein
MGPIGGSGRIVAFSSADERGAIPYHVRAIQYLKGPGCYGSWIAQGRLPVVEFEAISLGITNRTETPSDIASSYNRIQTPSDIASNFLPVSAVKKKRWIT